jgi:hypothetical protein
MTSSERWLVLKLDRDGFQIGHRRVARGLQGGANPQTRQELRPPARQRTLRASSVAPRHLVLFRRLM